MVSTRRNSRSAAPAAQVGTGAEAAPRTGDHDGATSASRPASLTAASSSRRITALSAFSASGRLSVTVSNAGIGFGEQGLVRRVGHRAIVPAR